jgi:ABC-2 type transport system permease protein
MTTASATIAPRATRTTPYRLTFSRALRSEWIKLSTLRSTWWSIGIVAALTIGIALLIALAVEGPEFLGIQAVVLPVQFTMLLAGILGVIAVTGEYSTGMIRSTLTADPVRGSVLAAKAVVVAGLMFVTSLITFVVAALIVTPILASRDIGIAWDVPADSFLPLVGAAFSMAVFALIGVAFGFLLRSGAGAIAGTIGLLFVLPIVVSIFPALDPTAWQWVTDLSAYLPSAASQSLILPMDGGLSAIVSLITLCGWVVAGLLAAWAVLRMRDA